MYDKPLKYPLMFEVCDLVVINKIDVLPYFDFDVEKAKANILMRNKNAKIFLISAKTGEGVPELVEYLANEIIKFKNGIDQLLIAVGNQDENSLLKINSDIYSLLPTYLEKTSKDKNKINIMKLKSLVLSSLAYSNSLEWENAKNVIGQAETKYKEMMDDVDYMKKYSYNLNKVYVLLEELKNSIDIEEIELCKMKYINFIEKI